MHTMDEPARDRRATARGGHVARRGNDVEMLGWAGLGVAMGDAGPSVKQAADAVTTGVDADGLALVLELLL